MPLDINPTGTQLCRRRTAKKRRDKIVNRGGWNLNILLSPASAKQLRELMGIYQASAVEVISNLILGDKRD